MASNSLGNTYRLTTFGESHGVAIGGIIDGVPSGIKLDVAKVQAALALRKPGQSKIVSARNEADQVHFLSGTVNGVTTGAPLGFVIYNRDHRSKDYDHLNGVFRPSHADQAYHLKYGTVDSSGSGRASARETANWVVAGAVADQILVRYCKMHKLPLIDIVSYVNQVGEVKMDSHPERVTRKQVVASMVRCPDTKASSRMQAYIAQLQNNGDSCGGIITTHVYNPIVGLGDPIFEKLHANLSKAMLSINAAHAFEYGDGFLLSSMTGSQANDVFGPKGKLPITNHSGGIQGGISIGAVIKFAVGFKPPSTIAKEQPALTKQGKSTLLAAKGRHDPCVVPRATVVVSSLTAMVLLDALMMQKGRQLL
ncbi:MAG: chorismate synthase [Bacteroidota bacterium]|jgi:chorismate synthase